VFTTARLIPRPRVTFRNKLSWYRLSTPNLFKSLSVVSDIKHENGTTPFPSWISYAFYTGRWEEYLDLRKRRWREAGEDSKMGGFTTCTLHQIILGWSNEEGWNRRHILYAWERWEMHTKFWSVNLKGNDHSEDPRSIWEDHRRMKWGGCNWLRIGSNDGPLWIR